MLTSLNDIKNYLGIPLSETTYDAFLTFQGTLVTESIEGYCGRIFNLATYTEKFFRNGNFKPIKDIFTFQYPIVSVVSVTEDGGDEITEYLLDKEDGILTRKYPEQWLLCKEELVIEYQAGYATIPSPILYAYYSIIEANYNKKVNGIEMNFGRDVQRISIPGALSIDFDYTLDANERKNRFGSILNGYLNILDPYRSERVITGQIGRKYE